MGRRAACRDASVTGERLWRRPVQWARFAAMVLVAGLLQVPAIAGVPQPAARADDGKARPPDPQGAALRRRG